MRITNNDLMKIAGYGGIIVASTGIFLQWRITDRTRNFEYYKDALKTLRAHPGASKLLGEPIKDMAFKLTDSDNFSDGETASFKVPVKGSNQKGVYYFWANRINEKWNITKAELELKNEPERRLVIIKEVKNES